MRDAGDGRRELSGSGAAGAPDREPVGTLTPDAFSRGFFRFFSGSCRRMLARSFAEVRAARGTVPALAELDSHPGPIVVCFTHPSWWDPILGVGLHGKLLPSRAVLAPMDDDQLARFRFMRKLGIFGIEPDEPASMDAMARYLRERFTQPPGGWTLWIAPQGTFTDPRAPLVVRPGAAAAAARIARDHGSVRVAAAAFEYAFWSEKKPEAFVRFAEIETDRPDSTSAWQRAITRVLGETRDRLSEAVAARDPGAFEPLLGAASGSVNPVYDLLLKLRGKGGSIAPRRAGAGGRVRGGDET